MARDWNPFPNILRTNKTPVLLVCSRKAKLQSAGRRKTAPSPKPKADSLTEEQKFKARCSSSWAAGAGALWKLCCPVGIGDTIRGFSLVRGPDTLTHSRDSKPGPAPTCSSLIPSGDKDGDLVPALF